ncbi:hypothetical protein [Aliiglaciecola sp. NS0011-25]|uniref:hypothetical protein n=1 Tax=Aliiglaciecola sp. NS0011-25 TaxID=3127654 RepID=UPI00310A2EAF
MSYRLSFVILLFLFALSACAGKPERHQEAEEIFTTKIHADGSKRFVLAILYEQGKGEGRGGEGKPEGKRGGGEGGRSRQGRGGRGQSESTQDISQVSSIQRSEGGSDEDKREAILELLDEKLTETGYCRHGFIELDFSQMRSKTEIVGECQESASQEDEQRW